MPFGVDASNVFRPQPNEALGVEVVSEGDGRCGHLSSLPQWPEPREGRCRRLLSRTFGASGADGPKNPMPVTRCAAATLSTFAQRAECPHSAAIL